MFAKFWWAMADGSMKPVYFEGPMSSEFLQDLICTRKGKNACSKSCICTEQHLACYESPPTTTRSETTGRKLFYICFHVFLFVCFFVFSNSITVNGCFTSKPTIYFNCPMHCLQKPGVACCKISRYFFSFIPIHFNHIYLANL
jgi:hypothetical protein